MGISWGGSIYPWKSGATISSIVIGILLLVALFLWEGYAELKYPAIPVKFFANRGFMALVCCATVASMFYYSAVLLWPQQVQQLFTHDVEYGGWLSCTIAASTALGQVCAGIIVRFGGNVRYWLIFSTFAMVGFVAALASLTPTDKNTGISLTILGPFFVGFIELTSLALAPLFCAAQDIGLASGLLASIRSAGGSVATTVYTTMMSNRLSSTILELVVPAAQDAGLGASQVPGLLSAIAAGDLSEYSTNIQEAVSASLPCAYAKAFKMVYLASIGFGGVAIIGCLISQDARVYLNSKVERKMGGSKAKNNFV